jgi:aryl-alcohol dehydrogenase-like predicted oxidoreductase
MDQVTLGRTGLRVGVMGLGAGGHSRLGQSQGKSEADSIAVVRRALELGINLIDTAEAYGTEPVVGKALRDVPRDSYVLSTKKGPRTKEGLISAADYRAGVEAGLQRLGQDYVDILHVHGVMPHEYTHVREEIIPVLLQLRAEGKIRWLGITENFSGDTTHETLRAALKDSAESKVWDVMMVGFNMLNHSARHTLLPHTQAQGIGTLCMFAVRRALSNPDALKEVITQLVANGQIDLAGYNADAPLDFLTASGVATSLTEAAYRYCRYEPGIDVVLSGTGSVDHLEENARALQLPPLPQQALERVNQLFAGVDSVSGN